MYNIVLLKLGIHFFMHPQLGILSRFYGFMFILV